MEYKDEIEVVVVRRANCNHADRVLVDHIYCSASDGWSAYQYQANIYAGGAGYLIARSATDHDPVLDALANLAREGGWMSASALLWAGRPCS